MIQGFSGGLLNRELIYQTDLPSFQRDFASLKTLNHGTGPDISTTSFRGSSATYFDADGVLQTAGTNVPRFDHNPSTGASLGLLIEEARTNSITRSVDFANAAWSKTSVTVTANTDVAPDGTTTASTITDSTTSAGEHMIDGGGSLTSLTNESIVTFSVFLKKTVGSSNFAALRILFAGGTAFQRTIVVNTNTGAFTVSGSPDVGSVVNVGAYWRVALTASNGSGNTSAVGRIYPAWNSTGTTEVDGTTTGSVVAWGAQLEQGAFPTSYIPTTNAAATRAADSAVVTPISSFYNQAEGTLFAEGSANTSASFPALVSIDDTTGDERMQLRRNSTSSVGFWTIVDGGVAQANIQEGSWTTSTQVARIIGVYKLNDFAVSFNGGAVVTDTSGTLPTVTRFDVGGGINSGRLNAHIRKIAYWPKRLTNTLLEQLTT